MNVRLAVVAVIVCFQGLGWGGLSQQALANSAQNSEANADSLPMDSLPMNSVHSTDSLQTDNVPIRTVPFIDEEIPEEILRTEIITEARSPLTGQPMSAADYAQLSDELRSPAGGNLVSQDLNYLIYLLQIRRAIKPILPFL